MRKRRASRESRPSHECTNETRDSRRSHACQMRAAAGDSVSTMATHTVLFTSESVTEGHPEKAIRAIPSDAADPQHQLLDVLEPALGNSPTPDS